MLGNGLAGELNASGQLNDHPAVHGSKGRLGGREVSDQVASDQRICEHLSRGSTGRMVGWSVTSFPRRSWPTAVSPDQAKASLSNLPIKFVVLKQIPRVSTVDRSALLTFSWNAPYVDILFFHSCSGLG